MISSTARLAFEADVQNLDVLLGRQVLEKLHKHYPRWTWVIDIPPNQNVVLIRNLDCDPYGKMAYLLHKDKLAADPTLFKVMIAGGELLERYRMQREGYNPLQMEGRIMHFERPDT